MGASDFIDYGKGTDPQAVFRDLIESARYEYGHGGYTGTIAEKDSFKVVTRTVMTVADASRKAEEMLAECSMWGPAMAIPITFSTNTIRTEKDLVIKATAGPLLTTDHIWIGTVREHLPSGVNPDHVVDVKVLEDVSKFRTNVRAAGKSNLVYRVGHLTFSTQAEARVTATELARRAAEQGRTGKYVVTAVKVTDTGGHDLVVAESVRTKRTLKVRVTLETPSTPPARLVHEGWLFFGLASC